MYVVSAMRTWTRPAWRGAAWVALWLAACAGPDGGRASTGGAAGGSPDVAVVSSALCESDFDCFGGRCTGGQCVECNNNGDCVWRFDGSSCRNGVCAVPEPQQPSPPLYASCTTDPSLQGDCGPDRVCTTIISGGFRCYQRTSATGTCPANTTSYMGLACLNRCDASTFCPSPLACDGTGWCVVP
jgi:hypothetical protein